MAYDKKRILLFFIVGVVCMIIAALLLKPSKTENFNSLEQKKILCSNAYDDRYEDPDKMRLYNECINQAQKKCKEERCKRP